MKLKKPKETIGPFHYWKLQKSFPQRFTRKKKKHPTRDTEKQFLMIRIIHVCISPPHSRRRLNTGRYRRNRANFCSCKKSRWPRNSVIYIFRPNCADTGENPPIVHTWSKLDAHSSPSAIQIRAHLGSALLQNQQSWHLWIGGAFRLHLSELRGIVECRKECSGKRLAQ